MRRAKLHKAVAVVTAMGMIAVSPMAALADTVTQVTITGEGSETVDAVSNNTADTGVSMTDVESTDGKQLNGNVTVKGDVTVTNEEPKSYNPTTVKGVDIDSDGGYAKLDIGGSVNVDATLNVLRHHAEGIATNTKSDISVGGDVTAATGVGTALGVFSSGDDVNINIGGDVEASSEEWGAEGVFVIGKTNVTVGGNVEANGASEESGDEYGDYSIGVDVESTESEVKVGGSVLADGYDAYGVYVKTYGNDDSVNISVGGDVDASGTFDGKGIMIIGNADTVDVKVEGDIKSSGTGIYVYGNGEDAKTSVTTADTLSAGDDYYSVLVVNTNGKAADPEITVWKIENTDNIVGVYDKTSGWNTEAEARIEKAINYIIKADATENGSTSSNGKIVLKGTTGTVTVGDKIYDTAHQDQEIIINVETAKGYKSTVQNNGTGILTLNADGTYTLTIPAGGGVDLKAVLEKIDISTRNAERTYTGGSGSGGGSGTGVATSSIYNGSWSQDNVGWKAQKSNGSYATSEWCQFAWNGVNKWYHFNAQGYADGGWFTDTDGQKYYLYNAHDGNYGYMYTGWNQIDGLWYYFNTIAVNGGSMGSLVTNGTTPDGYKVDAAGAWVQ